MTTTDHDHDHDHGHHPEPLAPIEARVAAIEAVLVEQGVFDPSMLDAIVDTLRAQPRPDERREGRRARVGRSRRTSARLLADGTAAIAELGFGGPEGDHMVVVENTPDGAQPRRVHAVLVLPVAGPRLAAQVVQGAGVPVARGARAARAARRDGTPLPDDVEVRVWDSSAEVRYLVLPERPDGTDGLTEDELAALVTRDAMIGVKRL